MNWIYEPWPWYVAGPGIVLVMSLLIYFGKTFGVSSNLRTLCSIAGAGKAVEFFKFDWKKQSWNLVFVFGSVIGGFIAHNYMTPDHSIALNPETISSLQDLGFKSIGASYAPDELFGLEVLSTWQGWLFLLVGGLLIGFGTRYAGGCTSGHAISGLSNLQFPSLIAVIGFFIGGLIMTFLVLPTLLNF
jgi:uncharacterized membrane protein YedE/YeeE